MPDDFLAVELERRRGDEIYRRGILAGIRMAMQHSSPTPEQLKALRSLEKAFMEPQEQRLKLEKT